VRAKWAAKSRESRGYGTVHRRLRERYRLLIEGGAVVILCARCRRRILPGEAFDLDHAPDRTSYLGPSHRRCNRLAGGKQGAAVTNARWAAQPRHVSSRVW
jgi:hypothetical protein